MLGFRELGRIAKRAEATELAARLLARANALYLDHGRYFATPAALPSEFFARVPALAETPSAESLALLAGASKAESAATLDALYAVVSEPDSTPSGDSLFALSVALSAK